MKNSIRCIIVDDEPMAIGLLEEMLRDLYTEIDVAEKHTKWADALPSLRGGNFDLLFLDISMPGKSGLDILSLLPKLKAEVIFITAHAEYALQAIKFHPSGYVLKPIEEKDLITATDKAIERIMHRNIAQNQHTSLAHKIGIPNPRGIDYIDVANIMYLEAINNCTRVVHTAGEMTSSYPLNKFYSILEKYAFYKVHRSFLVNINYVRRYVSDGSICITDGFEIPVSKNVREDFLKIFEKVSKDS